MSATTVPTGDRRFGGLEFRVLGPFDTIIDGTTLDLGGPKQRAVLAVLVMRVNEVVATGTLIDALWADDPPRSALAVVRTYVSRLRRALAVADDARLTSRAPGYVLETDPENVDARLFEALVVRARREVDAGQPGAASATLGRALALWRGDLLAGVPELDLLRPDVTRLEEMRLAARADRIDAELALGHHAEVVGELEALTREHPFRERLWGQRIVALYRSGRQTEALAAYQTLRSNLVDHAGVEPGPDLRALERDVLAQAEDLVWRPPADTATAGAAGQVHEGRERREPVPLPLPPAVDQASQPALVGRAQELGLAAGWFERARGGVFGALLVAGPPGIGKTALAARAARDAHAAGAAVVLGRADQGADVPFQPLAEAIGHWVAHADAGELRRLGEAEAALLARIVPALGERASPGEAAEPAESSGRARAPTGPNGSAHRQRLFEAIARWVEVLGADRPAVVVLEDLQWADPGTVLAVRHLVRHPPAAPVVLLATHRDTELDDNGLAGVLAAARAEPHVRHVALGGLRDADVAELVRSATGRDLDDAGRRFATQLGRATGRNPLFVRETLRHLAERGTIGPNGPWPPEQALAAVGVPAVVTELIDQRIQRLPPETVAVLQAASVLGEQVDVPVVGRIAGLSRIEVVGALEPAIDGGLIDGPAVGAGPFRFSHALVREAILDRVPPARRARTHWQAGQALASLSAGHPEPPFGEVARHLTAGVDAGEPEAAIAANVRAGWWALATLAFEDARDRFVTATELLRTAGDTDDQLGYEAWLGLGQASGVLEEAEGTRTGYLRAAAVARRRGWPERLAQAAVGFATYNAVRGAASPEDELTASLLSDEALAGLGEAPAAERPLLLALGTMRAVAADRPADAWALAESARQAAESLDDEPTALGAALLARAWALVGSPRPDQLRDTADRGLAVAARSPSRLLLRGLLVPVLAVPPLQVGDLAGFARVRRRVTEIPELRPEQVASTLSTWDAALALGAGRFSDVEDLARDVAPGFTVRQRIAEFHVAVTALERGAYDAAGRWATGYHAVAPTAVAPQAMLAWLAAEAGDRAGAARWVETLRGQRPVDRLGWGAPLALRFLAEVAAELGDRSLAADLLPVLADYAGQMLVSGTVITVDGAADRAIGQALLALGRGDEAVQRLAAGRRLEDALGADALAARTAYWHARALAARGSPGDAAAAQRAAADATVAARRLGMVRLAAEAAALAGPRH